MSDPLATPYTAWRIPSYIWFPDEFDRRHGGHDLCDAWYTSETAALDTLEAYLHQLAAERNPGLCFIPGQPYRSRWRDDGDPSIGTEQEYTRLGCQIHDEELRIVDDTPIAITRSEHHVHLALTLQWRWRAKRRTTTVIDGVTYQAVTKDLAPVSDWMPAAGRLMQGHMDVEPCTIWLGGPLTDLQPFPDVDAPEPS